MNSLTYDRLETLYMSYNHRNFVSPDPLQFLYDYPELRDREIVGLIASSLAYGRVAQILKSINDILQKIGDSPFEFAQYFSLSQGELLFQHFKHRFTDGTDIVLLFAGINKVLSEFGSFHALFAHLMERHNNSIKQAIEDFIEKLACFFPDGQTYLLPKPSKGSACKRFNLFLRWMIRNDVVDPGGWDSIDPTHLLIPLDTHMHTICRNVGILSRKSANWKAVEEATSFFKTINKADPTKYDFVLTRFGIRDELTINDLLKGE